MATHNGYINSTQLENETNNNKDQSNLNGVMIDLVASECSDIEIIAVSKNIANRKRKHRFGNVRNHQRTKIYVNSVNCSLKNQQESYIKEEIIISDASDSSDDDHSKKLKTISSIHNYTSKRKHKNNESLSSIILNCPKCNKTETVFSTTLKCDCKECGVNMSYVCNKCKLRYDSMVALYRHRKLQCRFVCKNKKELRPKKLFILRCSKCRHAKKMGVIKKQQKCLKCRISMCFECIICSKTYLSYSGLYVHTKLQCQPNFKNYYCNDCNFNTNRQNILLKHLHQIHGNKYSDECHCRICGRKFSDSILFKIHKLACGKPYYKCKFCKYKPKYLETLKKHLLSSHKDALGQENLETILEEATQLVSEITGNPLKKVLEKNQEESDLRKMQLSYCSKCDKTFSMKKGCRRCSSCETFFQYRCGSCSGVFKSSSSVYRHVHRQHGKAAYSCETCGRAFSFFGDANEHRKTCGKDPGFQCDFCTFKSRYKYNVRLHMYNMHQEIQSGSSCDFCKMMYKTARTLKRHMLTCVMRKQIISNLSDTQKENNQIIPNLA